MDLLSSEFIHTISWQTSQFRDVQDIFSSVGPKGMITAALQTSPFLFFSYLAFFR